MADMTSRENALFHVERASNQSRAQRSFRLLVSGVVLGDHTADQEPK